MLSAKESTFEYFTEMTSIFMNSTTSDSNGTLYVIATVSNSIIFILGTLGNGMVIWITGFKIQKSVSTNWFLNLAIADFIFAALRPLSIVREDMVFQLTYAAAFCKLNDFVKFLNMFASLFILTAVSLDRFVIVAHPVWCKKYRNMKLAAVATSFVWISATALSVPYLFYRKICIKGNTMKCCYGHMLLYEVLNDNGIRTILYIIRFVVGFLLPFSVIISCYLIITLKLKQRSWRRYKRSFKIIITIVVAFFFCWMPYHVTSFLKLKNPTAWNVHVAYKIASSIAYFNSCMNPVLYVYMGYTFRKQLHDSLLSALKYVFYEDFNSAKQSSISNNQMEALKQSTISNNQMEALKQSTISNNQMEALK
ncbi:C3a anaphylatoxin chemotactic receptor-like [Protopterus annectens]|uniref:C3a anaphylatoxin chemotactic receptor-like n=1 Tax=Protopterus annectens TaxID=7888 RepID=UPI001CFB4D6F|nr:C3a anaphylatoxin chemotactic receptor-like [Protopterus annectens]